MILAEVCARDAALRFVAQGGNRLMFDLRGQSGQKPSGPAEAQGSQAGSLKGACADMSTRDEKSWPTRQKIPVRDEEKTPKLSTY